MGLKDWWDEDVCGVWTEHKLLSRKFWITTLALVAVVGLDIAGRPLSDTTVNFVQYTVLGFIGIQGAIDFFRYRTLKKTGKDIGPNQGGGMQE